jgi:hypothetical protein
MNQIPYNSGDTVKYQHSPNETKTGVIKSISGHGKDRIIRLTNDVYIHESQIIFCFDLRYMN